MSISKIRMRMGEIEFECEGSETFLRDELPGLLTAASRLYSEGGKKLGVTNPSPARIGTEDEDSLDVNIKGTTATLCGKLKVKSGNDLVVAAAAHLMFVAGKAEFSRQELLDQVRGATGYFKETYSKNFTNYISSRVKAGQLMEPRTGHYALGAAEAERLRAILAT